MIAQLTRQLVSIERIEPLYKRAVDILLLELNYKNITLRHTGDFMHIDGLFDAIIVAACPDSMPDGLLDKLKNNSVLVLPLPDTGRQFIKRYRKIGGKITEEEFGEAAFVPMVK